MREENGNECHFICARGQVCAPGRSDRPRPGLASSGPPSLVRPDIIFEKMLTQAKHADVEGAEAAQGHGGR